MEHISTIIQKFNSSFQAGKILPKADDLSFFSGLTNDEIVQFIIKDHLIAFSVLKHANILFPGQVTSVTSAVNKLGPKLIADIFLNESSTTEIKKPLLVPFESFELRKKSLFKAILTRSLIKTLDKFGTKTPEVSFIIGLLSSIGDMPILYCYTDKHYSRHLSGSTLPWVIQEKLTGYNQSHYSYQLLKSWNFPKEITLPIRYVFQFNTIDTNPYITALYGATMMTLPFTYPRNFRIDEIINDELVSLLNLSKPLLSRLYREAIEITSTQLLSKIFSYNQAYMLL
jgi:hypothetical protein